VKRAPHVTAAARFAWRTGRRPSCFEARQRCATLALLVTLLVAIGIAGCRPSTEKETVTPAPSRTLTEVLAAHTPELMAIPGVVGTAESRLDDGRPCVLILVKRLTPELRERLPKQLEGWPVKIEESGEIHAMPDSAR
jgi:hypothetical protein